MLIKSQEEGSHWYHPDGTACHEVPYADPKKGMRKTSLTDARKLGLFPSVTNYLQAKSKPGLEKWKIEQAILSSLTLPRLENETDDDFASRVIEDSRAEVSAAADRGTLIHDILEEYCKNGFFECSAELLPYVEPFADWFDREVKEVVDTEFTLISKQFGYAGRSDLLYISKTTDKLTIGDYKNKKCANEYRSKRTGELSPKFYVEWAMQLAAYGNAYVEDLGSVEFSDIDLVSIIVPSDIIEGKVFDKKWEDKDNAFKAFQACRQIWSFENNYYPGLSN